MAIRPPRRCTRNAPGFSLGSDQSIAPDGSAVYTLSITNNDSTVCSDTTFDLSVTNETGNIGNLYLPSVPLTAEVTLAPGSSSNTVTLTVNPVRLSLGVGYFEGRPDRAPRSVPLIRFQQFARRRGQNMIRIYPTA